MYCVTSLALSPLSTPGYKQVRNDWKHTSVCSWRRERCVRGGRWERERRGSGVEVSWARGGRGIGKKKGADIE